MHACTSCGSALDASQPTPPHCPHCGATLTPSFGAPPGFAGHPGESTEAPIFGTPADSGSSHQRPPLAPRTRRQPPPAPGRAVDSGPPSIGLDDSPHNELDLGGGGASLELDLAGGPGSGMTDPPPGVNLPSESGLDFPAPVDTRPGDSGIDLPGPVGISASQVHEESNAFGLDLPAPAGHDLPAPAPPRPPPSSFRPPTPSAPPPPSRPPASAPSFSADLPAPIELDLPTPAAAAQPDDGLDLPIPMDLPTPGGQAPPQGRGQPQGHAQGQMLTPAGLEVQPTTMGVAPSNLEVQPTNMNVAPSNLEVQPTNMNVAPANLDMAPANLEVQPLGTPAGGSAAVPAPAVPGGPPSGPHPSIGAVPGATTPTPAAAATPAAPGARRGPSRGLLIAVGGLALVGLAGVGVLYSGILDPDDPEPATRGISKKPKETKESKETKSGQTPKASGPAAERSSTVLATMAKHTPAAYVEAMAAATEAGDAVGAAECALLLHYHFGPNPTSANEALATLQSYAGNTAGFVQRVVGLGAIAAEDFDGAQKALAGDEPRTRLYRGWLHLAQGKLDEAKAEADAVLGVLADEVGARHLALSVSAQRDPTAAVSEIQASVEKTPHPATQALLAQTATQTGQLAIARTAVDALDPAATDNPGVQAWTHTQHARVRAAQGDYIEALAAYDRSMALVTDAHEIQVERIRTLLRAKLFNDASAAVSALVRDRPKDLEAQLLQADVAIHSGDGDIALQVLETLTTSMPKDARVMRLKGEVHAMRLEVDEGQTAFAAARAFDPMDYPSAVGEAVLLSDAKRLPDALAVLETARTEAETAGRPLDVALLLVTKAELHIKAGERNAALEALDRALVAAPTHNRAQMLRGSLRLTEGQIAEGRADLVAVFDRTGGYPGLAGPLGRLFVIEGDFESLERLVGDRLRGEQTPDDLLVVGIRLRLHQSRADDARALVKLALTRRPADWEVHMLKAQLFISEGKATEALAEIELSRPAEPQPELMLQRGKILEFNARHDDAIPEYRRALEIDPDLYEARFLFGRLLHYKGGHGKAITELRKVLDRPRAMSAPWYPEVWLNIGLAQQAQGKHADAIASLKKATEIDPKLGEAWAKMGAFHENLNKHGEAIAALKKATAIGTKDDFWYADALMNLGRAQVKSGKKAAAKKSLKEFLEVASPESTSRAEAERLLGGL